MIDEIYNQEYYETYSTDGGAVSYETPTALQAFFSAVADRIVADLNPKTVLDAGCAMGLLVAELRDRGVEAYGIDISNYAISKVREDIRPYCVVGSLSDPLDHRVLPQKFDLVTNIEVIEHMSAEDGAKALENLCSITDCILFSSTPDDFTEPTHINVQEREYWATEFARNGFYDDLSYRPTYITPYAVCYTRRDNWIEQLKDYEVNIRNTDTYLVKEHAAWSQAVNDKETHIVNQSAVINNQIKTIDELNTQIHTLNKTYDNLYLHYVTSIQQREELKAQLEYFESQYHAVMNSKSMKLTKPMRTVVGKTKQLIKSNSYTYLTYKGLRSLCRDGVVDTWRRVQRSIQIRSASPGTRFLINAAEEKAQRKAHFSKQIKFSILVPLYNTPKNYLCEMIQSVLDQNYTNWELCLADGSDAEHNYVGQVCKIYAKKDPRIIYKKLDANYGISGNTNACIEMATGDFIALFDHDDLLHPSALYEMMCAICEQDADFVYTDENTFRRIPEDAYCPHFKPDFAPDTLRANNYICHFNAFDRSLLEKVGGFRPECDGSQDFDMMLRLTEQAKKIVHIPKILYYWRAHENSVAVDISAKPYVIDAAKKAIQDHLGRVGLKGEVLDSCVPSMYRIRYEIKGTPLVSIIIPNYEHLEDLQKCLDSIYTKTTYTNFEIIIVENNSFSESLFQYYEEIQNRWSNLKVVTWPNYFNYSAINNFGAQYASGEHLLLLNNDVEVISPDWIQEMLMYSQRSDVGAVGAKLYYPDNTIQHGGVGIGLLTLAGHYHRGFDRNHPGYMGRLIYAHNQSAVTAACVMISRNVWDSIGGLDESFEVAFNDIDMCMRIREAGYLIVWTPFAELYHYESKSRGLDESPEKRARFVGEVHRFQDRWKKQLDAGDPYYNPNFSLDSEDFRIKK